MNLRYSNISSIVLLVLSQGICSTFLICELVWINGKLTNNCGSNYGENPVFSWAISCPQELFINHHQMVFMSVMMLQRLVFFEGRTRLYVYSHNIILGCLSTTYNSERTITSCHKKLYRSSIHNVTATITNIHNIY